MLLMQTASRFSTLLPRLPGARSRIRTSVVNAISIPWSAEKDLVKPISQEYSISHLIVHELPDRCTLNAK